MRRLIALGAGLLLTACATTSQPDDTVRKSLTNINDELVNIQRTITDMQLHIEDLDRKVASNAAQGDKQTTDYSAMQGNIQNLSGEIAALKTKMDTVAAQSAKAEQTAVQAAKTAEAVTAKVDVIPAANNSMAAGAPSVDVSTPAAGGSSTPNILIIDETQPVKTATAKPMPSMNVSPANKNAMYTAAYDLLKANKHEESRAKFEEFLRAFPNDDLSDNAMYWIGESFFAKKDFDSALTTFKDLVERFPMANKTPDAMLKVGVTYEEKRMYSEAKAAYQNVINKQAGTPAAAIAAQKLKALQ